MSCLFEGGVRAVSFISKYHPVGKWRKAHGESKLQRVHPPGSRRVFIKLQVIIGLKLETWPTSADEGKVSWSPMLFRTTLVSEDSSHVSGKSQKCHASVHCTSLSFSCHVLCTGQERMNLSPLTGSRAVVCFLWPALLLSISRVVSLAPHLPLFLVLGQSSLPFHHVRLQS